MTPEEKIKKIESFCKDKRYWQEQIKPETYESEIVWQLMDWIIEICKGE